jgi:EREBP-like factor
VRSDSKSGYKGVEIKPSGRFQAYIGKPNGKGRQIKLGTYDTPEEAARAYDKKAIELHGEFTNLNFPKDKQ